MAKKLSSYQKLKAEITKLRKDIYCLVRERDEVSGIEVNLKYELLYGMDEMVMFGEPAHSGKIVRGFFDLDVANMKKEAEDSTDLGDGILSQIRKGDEDE